MIKEPPNLNPPDVLVVVSDELLSSLIPPEVASEKEPPNLKLVEFEVESEEPNLNPPEEEESEKVPPNFSPAEVEFVEPVPNLKPDELESVLFD